MANLGSLKGGFCSAEECKLTSPRSFSAKKKKEKRSTFSLYQLAFLSSSHIISNKTTVKVTLSDCSIRVFKFDNSILEISKGVSSKLSKPI